MNDENDRFKEQASSIKEKEDRIFFEDEVVPNLLLLQQKAEEEKKEPFTDLDDVTPEEYEAMILKDFPK